MIRLTLLKVVHSVFLISNGIQGAGVPKNTICSRERSLQTFPQRGRRAKSPKKSVKENQK